MEPQLTRRTSGLAVGAALGVLAAGGAWVALGRAEEPVALLTAAGARQAEEGWDYDALSSGSDDPTEFVEVLGAGTFLTRESVRPGLDLTVLTGPPRPAERVVPLPRVRVGRAASAPLPAYADAERLVWLPRDPVPGRLRAGVLLVEDAADPDGGPAAEPALVDADLSPMGEDLVVADVWLADGRLWFQAGDRLGSLGPEPGAAPRPEIAGVRAADVQERVAWTEDPAGPVRVRGLGSDAVTELPLTELGGEDCAAAGSAQVRTAGDLVAVTLSCSGSPDRLVVRDLDSGRTLRVRAATDAALDLSERFLAVSLPVEGEDEIEATFLLEVPSGRWVRLAPRGEAGPAPSLLGDVVSSGWGSGDLQDHVVASLHLRDGARPESSPRRTSREALGLLVGRAIGLDEVVTADPGRGWWSPTSTAVAVMLDPADLGPRRLRVVTTPTGERPAGPRLRCGGSVRCVEVATGVGLRWQAGSPGRLVLLHRDPDSTDVLELIGVAVGDDPRRTAPGGVDLDGLVRVLQDPRFGTVPDEDLEREAAEYYGIE